MTTLARTTLLSCLLGLATACGGGSDPAPPAAPATVTVTTSAATSLVNTPVTVRAHVLTAAGAPVPAGTAVGFATTGGTISQVTTTDAAGDATASLTSTAHGAVTVIVTVGSLPAQTRAVTFIDPDEPHAVELTSGAAVVDVGETVLLTARVTPAGTSGTGDPTATIADGTVVTFTASAGTISAVTTTVDGLATATLGGIAAPALVFVSASAGGAESLPVLVEFTDSTVPTSVTLAGAPAAGFTGEQGPVALTATVLTLSGAPVPVGTAVAFAVVAGAGTLSAADGQTDAAGRASVTLRSAVEGAVTVTATAFGGVTGSVSVGFTDPSRPVALALGASTATARIDGQVPVLLTVALTPADPAHGQIANGTPVAFTITAGTATLSSPTVTTAGGLASVALASGVEGSVTVRAAAGALADTVTVVFTNPSRPASVSLVASPAGGRLDGGGPVTLTATVTPADPAVGAIADGTAVTFAITSGSGALSSLAAPTAGGVASVTLSSAVEGSITVRAAVGAVSDAATVAFTNPSRAAALALTANPPAGRLDVGGPVTLTATVTPADQLLGTIADGTPVTFAITSGSGTLSAATATTSGGAASVTLAGDAEGSVTVRATVAGAVIGTATVTFTNPSRPVALSLAANPPAGRLDVGPVTLTAVVAPADPALGVIADGTPVAFAITSGSGTLSAASALTAGGVAVVTLTGSEGSVAVRATVAGSVEGAVTVPFTNPSKPTAVSLAATPGSGKTGGQGPVTLTATVTPADQVLGTIPNGTPVTFAITSGSGTLSAATATTTGGVATVTLNAAAAGTVTVTASAGAPAVTSTPVAVPFIVQPTLAVVTVRTTGTLPAGAAIGGVSALVTVSPSAGLTLAATDVAASGAAAGSLLAANVADVSAGRLALISAAGFQPGEFATLTFHVAPGTFPAAQDFAVALTGPGVIDLDGQTVPLGVAIQGVSIQ